MNFFPLNINDINPFFSTQQTGILLDSSRCSKNDYLSYLFLNPEKELYTFEYDSIEQILLDVDRYQQTKWVCGYLSYEASYALEKKFKTFRIKNEKQHPLIWFGIFDQPWIFDHTSGLWNRNLPKNYTNNSKIVSNANKLIIKHLNNKNDFKKTIHKIKNHIKAGDTYQVNYTYDVSANSELQPFNLYQHLRKSQKTPYTAFIQNQFGNVASFSPELFFSKKGQNISVKPMKGTAPRGSSIEEDNKIRKYLQKDSKNRAENLMIVDLLRNDLGRICLPGSVNTAKLFDIETHPTIHQMTSTITGKLLQTIKFSDLIKNIFPCGSVTGAPKIRTMEIINSIEKGWRGVYCGAIGYISPEGISKFNVPIRTLQKRTNDRNWRYRVGSGIIWDSTAADEWNECGYKCRFLETDMPDFNILETLYFHKDFLYKSEHIERMQSSADYFNFTFSEKNLHNFMNSIEKKLDPGKTFKIRILLNKLGDFTYDKSEILHSSNHSHTLLFSETSVDEHNIFLFHKTNYRPWFAKAMNKISNNKCYDIVFCNSKGQITEGARSNIFMEKQGKLFTPPISCGLLPGILRSKLIKQKKCQEKILYPQDIYTAEKVFCGNSVRGLVEVDPKK